MIDLYNDGYKYQGSDVFRDFYENYIEFKKYIEIRVIDYKKIYKGRPIMHSRYASSYKSLIDFFTQFKGPRFNIYIGSNTREIPERKDSVIKYRRTFYFDIEAEGKNKKPPLTNEKYYKKLLDTVFYLRDCLKEEGLIISVVKESGRGMHIGIKIKPLVVEKWDVKYKKWFKSFIEKYEKNRPHKDIKFSDSVFNPSRIESAPGTIHYKYEEKPLRKIIYFKIVENDMEKVLEKVEEPIKKIVITKGKFQKKYNNETIFNSPEFQLLINNDDLPEGELHSKIITQIKILVRDNGIDPEIVSDKLSELGYDEVVDTPDEEDYQYNPMIYNYWCLDNFEYCYDKKILLNTEIFKKKGQGYKNLFKKGEPSFLPKDRPLTNNKDLINYIKEYNQINSEIMDDVNVFYKDFLVKKIKELSITEKLWKYVLEMNKDYFDSVCFYSYPKK